LTVFQSVFGISAFRLAGSSGDRLARKPAWLKLGMSAASSWTMSAELPPTNEVRSLSWTELTSTGTIETWIDGCVLVHELTMPFIAATVVGCQTYVARVSLTTSFCVAGRACAAAAPRAAHSATTTAARRSFFICGSFLVVCIRG